MAPLETRVRDRSREESGQSPRDLLTARVRDSTNLARECDDGGEETETAPEAEDDNQDDSITRYRKILGYIISSTFIATPEHL